MNNRMKNSTPNASIKTLLSGIVDYAGLFPPSGLTMAEAVINYATYKNSNYDWMLGRFVVPVRRLDEFLENAQDFISRDQSSEWRLSVLASEDIDETVQLIEWFNEKNSPKVFCDTIEAKANTSAMIEDIAGAVPNHLITFIEVPVAGDIADLVSTLAIREQCGKIRMGGVTKQAFPKLSQIMRFIYVCLAANVPFKATAGLHHPVRCIKPLTYEQNAPEGLMNGFLNVFLAVAFLRMGYKKTLIKDILEEELAENFIFDETGVTWRQEFFLNNDRLRYIRRNNIISFGSCSFEEPIEDLQEVGLL